MMRRRKLTILAGLSLVSAVVLMTSVGIVSVGFSEADRQTAALPVTFKSVRRAVSPAGSYDDITRRPVFAASRRPFAAPLPTPVRIVNAVPAPPPPVIPPVDRLLAVVIGPKRRIAVVQLPSGKTSVLIEGDQIGDWTLNTVAPDHVAFRSPPGEVLIPFTKKRGGSLTASQSNSHEIANADLRQH